MSDHGLGSRTDLDTLRRSGRGKLVVLTLLLTSGVASAFWTFAHEGGTGNAEDPAKVLIVTHGESHGYSASLDVGGFEAVEGTFATWEQKAEEEVPELGQRRGVAAIMALADRFGYGFVAFERPSELDFSDIEIDGVPEQFVPEHKFAVLSAGDFAFPHVMTVNPPPSKVVRARELDLLRALFEHDQLAQLQNEDGLGTVEGFRLRDRLDQALERLDKIPAAERLVETIQHKLTEALREGEHADPKPHPIADQDQSTMFAPLANGQVLTMGRRFELTSDDAVTADLAFEDAWRIVSYERTSLQHHPWDGQLCEQLAGGIIRAAESPVFVGSVDGHVVLVKTLSRGLELWQQGERDGSTFAEHGHGPSESTCAWKHVGRVPLQGVGEHNLGVPDRSGQVARAGAVDGRGFLSVVRAGSEQRQLLGLLDGVELEQPLWIDADVLVARGRDVKNGTDALYFFSVRRPLVVRHLSASSFEHAGQLGDVAVVPGKPAFVVTAGELPSKLHLARLPVAWSDLFGYGGKPPIALGDAIVREGLPTVVAIDGNAVETVLLSHEGRAHQPAVSPDGRAVAFTITDLDANASDKTSAADIAIVSLDNDSGVRLVTRNRHVDRGPRFTSDSSAIVFETLLEVPRTTWTIAITRVAEVGRSQR